MKYHQTKRIIKRLIVIVTVTITNSVKIMTTSVSHYDPRTVVILLKSLRHPPDVNRTPHSDFRIILWTLVKLIRILLYLETKILLSDISNYVMNFIRQLKMSI